MKTLRISTSILILFCIPFLLNARGPGGGGGGPGSGGGLGPGGGGGPGQAGPHSQVVATNGSGMATLDALLSLSDEELEQLEATIRSIREMSPGQRQAYKERISAYSKMPEVEKQNLQMAWGQLDASVRAAWRDYMSSLDEEEKDRVRTELHEISPADRTQWRIDKLREADLLPEDLDW